MAFNFFGGANDILLNMLLSPFFWLLIIIIILGGVFLFLWRRKKKKFTEPVIELIDLGNGKIKFDETKGGWFKSKTFLFGLWDYGGEDKFKTLDNREIQQISSEDYHEIRGKRGVVAMRDPADPEVLLPISKMNCVNRELLLSIAPADFRDTGAKLMSRAEAETMKKLDKYLPYIAIGFCLLFGFIVIIIQYQLHKFSVEKANELVMDAIKLSTERCGQDIINAPSTSGAP